MCQRIALLERAIAFRPELTQSTSHDEPAVSPYRPTMNKYAPEFVPPKRNGSIDVGNFDAHHTKKTLRESIVKMTDEQIQAARFDGFTYNGDEDDESALVSAMRNSTISARASTASSTLKSVGEEESDEEH